MKKPSNEIVKEYEKIDAEIKLLEKRKSELSGAFKDFGPFTTLDFVVSIAPRIRESMVGVEAATKVLGPKEKLKALGLIAVSEFKVVQVSRKVQ